MKTYLAAIGQIIAESADEGVQIRLANPGKLRLIGPAEAVERIKPRVLENKDALLEHLSRDPWAWLTEPVTPEEKNRDRIWDSIAILQDILKFEGWALRRSGKSLVIWAAPPYRPEQLRALHAAIQALRGAWPLMVAKTEFFPPVTQAEAQDLLRRIEACHQSDGFRVKPNWGGIDYPRHWPVAFASQLLTIYVESIQEERAA